MKEITVIVAQLMAASARTAPKAGGKDFLEIVVLSETGRKTTGQRRPACRRRLGVFGTIFDIGHAAGPILAGFLLARYSYRFSFQMMAAMLLVALPFFLVTMQARNGDGPPPATGGVER